MWPSVVFDSIISLCFVCCKNKGRIWIKKTAWFWDDSHNSGEDQWPSLMNSVKTFEFSKRIETLWSAEQLLASQEEFATQKSVDIILHSVTIQT